MNRCIYCLEEKPIASFNREHVVPDSFGRFDHNLVLTCVCRDCNSYFGDTLDQKLAKDSIEGLHRYFLGLKPLAGFSSLGRRSTTRFQINQEGPTKGVWCQLMPTEAGETFDLKPLPQVGFATCEDGPFEYHLIDRLPAAKDLVKRLCGQTHSQLFMRVWGCSYEEASSKLQVCGYPQGDYTGEALPNNGLLRGDIVFVIDHPEYRALAKIAFNHLAYVLGPAVARLPNFNEIRRYVRNDVRPSARVVRPVPPRHVARKSTGQPTRAHFLTTQRNGDLIFSQISLFSRVRYVVTLSRDPLSIDMGIQYAHVFDLDARRVVSTPPPPLP